MGSIDCFTIDRLSTPCVQYTMKVRIMLLFCNKWEVEVCTLSGLPKPEVCTLSGLPKPCAVFIIQVWNPRNTWLDANETFTHEHLTRATLPLCVFPPSAFWPVNPTHDLQMPYPLTYPTPIWPSLESNQTVSPEFSQNFATFEPWNNSRWALVPTWFILNSMTLHKCPNINFLLHIKVISILHKTWTLLKLKMPIITSTQDGKTVNAMTQTTDLFPQPSKPSWEQQMETDEQLASWLWEMGVAELRHNINIDKIKVARIMMISNITIKHQTDRRKSEFHAKTGKVCKNNRDQSSDPICWEASGPDWNIWPGTG